MLPTTIREPPRTADYTPLAEHLEATPAVFFAGKPVLHLEARSATAAVPRSQCDGTLPMFPSDAPGDAASEEPVERTVDVIVTSENLVLFSTEYEAGVAIPYPAIAIHAIQTLDRSGEKVPAVWMQLELWDSSAGDDESNDPIELTLSLPASSSIASALPEPADPAPTTQQTPPPTTAQDAARRRVQALYAAITACAELHPDPADSDSDADDFDRIILEGGGRRVEGLPGAWELGEDGGGVSGGLPPPMPGSSGWITAENVHEFFDEEGNWIGGEAEVEAQEEEKALEGVVDAVGGQAQVAGELGEGAGRVRDRSEVEREERKAAEEPVALNGSVAGGEEDGVEAKKQRVE